MKSYVFPVTVQEDSFPNGEKAYHAFCPGLKGCHTWGHSPEEALANIQEAVQIYIEDLLESGDPVPVDPEKGVVALETASVVVNV